MNRKITNEELHRLSAEEFRKARKFPLMLILDNVRSKHNVGSIFRSADAFRAAKILLCGITATPPDNEIHKSALGAENTVAWEYFPRTSEAVHYARSQGYLIAGIEQTEQSLSLETFRPEKGKKYAFVFGHEIKGVAQEIIDGCDFCLEIPQYGTKHSLNVAVSAGIILWEICRQIKAFSTAE